MTKIIDKIFAREDHTCPWWLCFTFDNPVRALLQNPFKILSPYVKQNDTVLDIGPGMGYFTFPLAQMAGVKGKVIALDIQEGMLNRLKKKAAQNKIKNVHAAIYDGNNFCIEENFDFILLFWMYHEVKNKPVFIQEIKKVMKPDSKILIAEPKIHVDKKRFDASITLLIDSGFKIVEEPEIALSRTVVLQK